MGKNLFFFDLEAGGLLGSQSSILSAAYGSQPDNVRDLYAAPTQGSRVYEWSDQNVWQPIQRKFGHRIENERDVLSKFIKQLEQADTIAGWNIGYHAQPVHYKEGLRGFDLPMLATRARKYEGMSERLRLALQGKQVRDIGQEYAVIAARVALQNKDKIDKDVYEQAVGFQKKIGITSLSDTQEAARLASTHQIKFAGWKQELMFETMFGEKMEGAHEAAEDVRAGLRLSQLSEADIEQRLTKNIGFWNKEVVFNKLMSSAKSGVGPDSKQFKSAEEMFAKAADPSLGLTDRFTAGLDQMASDYGVDVERLKAGQGIGTEKYNIFRGGKLASASESFFQNLPSKVFATLKANKGSTALIGGVGAMALLKPGRLFSGRDDEYNTIEGLSEKGMTGLFRSQNTDFGSGYQGSETSDFWLDATMAGGAIGTSAFAYSQLKFGEYLTTRKYPRLAEMRKYGRRGMHMVSTDWGDAFRGTIPLPTLGSKTIKQVFRQFKPVSSLQQISKSKGLAYMYDNENILEFMELPKEKQELLKRQMYLANIDQPLIGPEKMRTYEHLQAKGFTAQPFTVSADKIVHDEDTFETMIQAMGGRENVVIKEKRGVLSQGVWLGMNALEADEHAFSALGSAPEDFMFQKKLDLTDEFRVVTVGDKPIYTAYRWGPQGAQDALSALEAISPKLAKKAKAAHLTENIVPVFDQQMKQQLEEFATSVSRNLPYEIGAFDIGLTKTGQLQLIEAQRGFGTIKHPYVAEKIYQEITGKMGLMGRGIMGGLALAGAGAGALLYHLSGKDDDHNTIEGLRHDGMAWQMRQALTDFGSGWVRKAISVGASQAKIMEAAKRAGKEIITSGKESFIVGQQLGKGGFGQVHAVQSLTTGKGAIHKQAIKDASSDYKHQEGLWTRLKNFIIGKQSDKEGVFGPRAFNNILKEARKTGKYEQVQSLMIDTLAPLTRSIKRSYSFGRFQNPLHYEAALQAKAHKAIPDLVPEVLGKTEKGYLQAFTGRPVRASEGMEAAEFLDTTFREAMKSRKVSVLHGDPDISNLIKTQTGFQIIDFGVAAPKGIWSRGKAFMEGYDTLVSRAAQMAQQKAQNLSMIAKNPKVTSAASPRALRKRIKEKQAAVHREATKRATGNMQRPGRRHTKQAGTVIL